MYLHMYNQYPWNAETIKQTGSPAPTVPELYKIHSIFRTLGRSSTAFVKLCATFSGFENRHYINIVAHLANLSQPRTGLQRSKNAASFCSPAREHITTPTRSIPEAPEIKIPPYYGHTVVVPMVFALEGFHCTAIDCCHNWKVLGVWFSIV